MIKFKIHEGKSKDELERFTPMYMLPGQHWHPGTMPLTQDMAEWTLSCWKTGVGLLGQCASTMTVRPGMKEYS